MERAFVIVGGSISPKKEEIILFFSDSFEMVDVSDLETLAVLAGVFPSKRKARKSGLCGVIPFGISLIGTKRNRFWVWSPCDCGDVSMNKSFDKTNKFFGGA